MVAKQEDVKMRNNEKSKIIATTITLNDTHDHRFRAIFNKVK